MPLMTMTFLGVGVGGGAVGKGEVAAPKPGRLLGAQNLP